LVSKQFCPQPNDQAAVIDQDGVTIRHVELDPSVDYQGRVRDIV
jgi:hypothetical protein